MATFNTICSVVRTNCFSRPSIGIGHRPQFLHRMIKPMMDHTRIKGVPPMRSNISDCMAFHFGTRCLPPLSRVRSTYSRPRAQFVCREAEPFKLSIRMKALSMSTMNTNNGSGSELGDEYDELQDDDICVSETSLSCLPVWKTDNILSNLKVSYFVNFLDENDKEYFVACFPEEDGTISPKYSTYPPSFLAKDYSFKGCGCNGLLHFHFGNDKLSHHALWNPTTCEYKILPPPFVEPCLLSCQESFAMWSDHRFENYKLLRLVCNFFNDEAVVSTRERCQIHLYSLKTNSWKQIPASEFGYFYQHICARVNGVFYCMASQKGTRDYFILAFDFSTETLSSLPFPNHSKNHASYDIEYSFLEYKGLLSVLKCFFHEVEGDPEFRNYELWIMSDGSWKRESVFHARGIEHPLLFSHDGKLLFFSCSHYGQGELVVFDRSTRKLKQLGVKNTSRRNPTMFSFFKSFVQLNGISCVEEKQEKEENYEDVIEK